MPLRPRLSLRLVAVPLLLCTAVLILAQSKRPEPQRRFALEIADGNNPVGLPAVVSEREGYTFYTGSALQRLRHGEPHDGRWPSLVKVSYKVQGDAVLLTLSVYFGKFNEKNSAFSVRELPTEVVGSYLVRVYESVTLNELVRFGVKPLTCKVLSPEAPPEMLVRAYSNAPSLGISIVREDRTGYGLILQNLSSRSVMAVLIDRPVDSPFGKGKAQLKEGQRGPLMAPGGMCNVLFGPWARYRPTPEGLVLEPPPPYIVLEAAFFEDGSYEGEPDQVARMEAGRIARRTQRLRIEQLVRNVLSDPTTSEKAKLVLIRTEIEALPDRRDQVIVSGIRSRFPDLAIGAMNDVESAIADNLFLEKAAVLGALREFPWLQQRHEAPLTLSAWWKAWNEKN